VSAPAPVIVLRFASYAFSVDPQEPLRCSECKREPREDENSDDEWRAVSDGVGEQHIFCPECWEREFGESVAPTR
jgi:hypothetical protein